ncbi:uncharacterized protein LOC129614414 [Condylostylus longicornis]|uniref:uncharacterized protein LOC129614414 n=1 Tax=Condylostylus longicornis TaxID=2530218 RepID=UPI00244E1580|nr:uncharacterized protein LOC129614414 [Condylostylus longicornis]
MSDTTVIIISALLLISWATWCQAQQCDPNMSHSTHPMPNKNPLMFYICVNTDTPFVIKCPKDSGFVSTATVHGCISFKDWPNAPKDRIPSCSLGNHQRLYRHINPSLYFACKDVDMPILLKCNDGQGFTYTHNRVGCVDWVNWKLEDQVNDE